MTTLYAWTESDNGTGIGDTVYTLSEEPQIGDAIYNSAGDIITGRTVDEVGSNQIMSYADEIMEVYYDRDAASDIVIAEEEINYVSTFTHDGTTYTLKDAEARELLKKCTPRNVGEFVWSSLPLTDAALHLCDGTLIQGDGIYADFVNHIAGLYAANPDANYFTDETSWQTSVTTYGVCGKYVYDSGNNTVRLPKVTGFVEGTTDLSVLGNLVEAGLPNIVGTYVASCLTNTLSSTSGALYSYGSGSTSAGQSGSGPCLGLDASRSSSIYGNSNTVQPQSIKGFLYIVVATSTKTDIQINIDNISTDLNSKADTDLSNTTPAQSFKTSVIEWGMPDYSAGVSKTWSGVKQAESNGYLAINGQANGSGVGSYGLQFSLDRSSWTTILSLYTATNYGSGRAIAPVTKGIYYQTTGGGADNSLTFYPMKGAN